MKKNWRDKFSLPRNLSKMLLCMKLTFVFCLCLVMQTFANVSAQTVSLKKHNVSLEEIIWELKAKTTFVFLYSDDDIANVKGISIDAKDLDVDEVLKKCLEGTDLKYVRENNAFIIKKSNKLEMMPQVKERRLSGKVMDKTGQPLPGVTVLLEGTTIGVISDAEGKFALSCPATDKVVLVFTFVGMKTQKVVFGDKNVIDVVMQEEVQEMEEAVVTGIYTRKKESFTGSAATYTKKDLQMIGTQNIIQSLKTLDPAMLMIESKTWGSDPNRLPDIEVRGKTSIIGLKSDYEYDPNQPLFILDGVETDLQTIVNLNMDRVASVTILKDAASTAIYGSKAANGVIVVETVQPEAGVLRVSYNGNFGVQFPDLTDYNLMDAGEKLEFERRSGKYTSRDGSYSQQVDLDEKYFRRLKEVKRGVDTYWLSEPLRTVFNHSHNLYIDGGDDAMRYGLGIGYKNNDGVMKGSNRDIVSGNIDLSYRKKTLLFSNKFSMDVTKSEREPVSFSDFAWANPYNRKTTENGDIPMYLEGPDQATDEYINPLYKFMMKNTKETNMLSLRDNFNAEWQILSSLRVRGRFGVTKTITK